MSLRNSNINIRLAVKWCSQGKVSQHSGTQLTLAGRFHTLRLSVSVSWPRDGRMRRLLKRALYVWVRARRRRWWWRGHLPNQILCKKTLEPFLKASPLWVKVKIFVYKMQSELHLKSFDWTSTEALLSPRTEAECLTAFEGLRQPLGKKDKEMEGNNLTYHWEQVS